jgi:hypothetical protein
MSEEHLRAQALVQEIVELRNSIKQQIDTRYSEWSKEPMLVCQNLFFRFRCLFELISFFVVSFQCASMLHGCA